MARIELPYIAWRDGRPRFVPGPRERAMGYEGEDLRHADGGQWFTLDEADAWAKARHAEILKARESGRKPKAPRMRRGRTLGDLLEAWVNSGDVAGHAPNTKQHFRRLVNAVRYRPGQAEAGKAGAIEAMEPFALAPVSALGKPEAKAFYEYAKRVRGHHMALSMIAAVRLAWSWGEMSVDWRLGANPARALKLKRPKGRVVIWTDAEVRAFIAGADALGMASIGDAVMLGLFTGQRQADRIELVDRGLASGRRRFEQNKTAAIVEIPETPQLKGRLETARARVAALALRLGTRPTTIVVNEESGRAYRPGTYRRRFGLIRAAVAKGIIDEAATAAAAAAGRNEPVYRVAPCPSILGKRDQDFRDTAVTWLARAGCTLPEIAAITGHSLRSIHQVLAHYLAITPELADSAIAKLVAWMDKEGMAV